jgi:hypothetical protein
MNDEVEAFLRRLVDPEDFGWAVTQEVRDQVKLILQKYEQNSH